MDAPLFPNYMQMTPRVRRRFWDALRALSLVAGLGLCVSLIVWPQVGLFVLWGVLVPLLPLLFFIAPGFWRNICPLAASNQVPRRFGFTRGAHTASAAARLRVPCPDRALPHDRPRTQGPFQRRTAPPLVYCCSRAARGVPRWPLLQREERMVQPLLSAASGAAACTGRRRSSSCANSHCEPCVGCAKNCYDFNPYVAQLADLYDADPYRGAYRKIFAGALPALVLAFYTVDAASGWHIVGMYGTFGLYILGGIGAFFVPDSVPDLDRGRRRRFRRRCADLYYWFTCALPRRTHRRLSRRDGPDGRAAHRCLGAERASGSCAPTAEGALFVEEATGGAAGAPRRRRRGCAARGGGERRARRDDRSRRHAHRRRCQDRRYSTIVERHGLPIEAGCRMGICGSDPVCVVSGAENLSPVGDEERMTLERLGLAANTRMACSARVAGPVSMSLDAGTAASPARLARPARTRPLVRGRRRSSGTGSPASPRPTSSAAAEPSCSIDIVAREQPPPLQPHGDHTADLRPVGDAGPLSAPRGHGTSGTSHVWLNTHCASAIDPERPTAQLATGETLRVRPADRHGREHELRAADRGVRRAGSFVLRSRGRDAHSRLVQETGAPTRPRRGRRPARARGRVRAPEARPASHRARGGRQTCTSDSTSVRANCCSFPRGLDRDHSRCRPSSRWRTARAAVKLSDGSPHPGRALPRVCGMVPTSRLRADAGLKIDRGVVVDDHMRTSDPNIFAAGDVAERKEMIYGLWRTAIDQAQVAAATRSAETRPTRGPSP